MQFPRLPGLGVYLRFYGDANVSAINFIDTVLHTDDNGPDARNLGLSERRAASVMTWLTAHGIEAGRLESHGFGETRPAMAITGLVGAPLNAARAQNRRVEFNILDPRPAAAAAASATSTTPTTPTTPAP